MQDLSQTPPTAPPVLDPMIAAAVNADPSETHNPPQRGRNDRFAFIAASAAAVLLLVAGIMIFSPSNTGSALADVHAAAQQTADADSGRATTVFTVDVDDGAESGQLSGQLAAEFNGSDLAVTVDVDELPGEFREGPSEMLTGIETRLVNDTIYVKPPFGESDKWVAVPAPDFLGRQLSDLVDPRTVLTEVQSLVETEEVGSAEVNGVSTTQYRSVVDLGDDTLGQSGWLAGLEAQIDAEADGEITVNLFVDGDGILRQLDVSGDLIATGSDTGSASFSVSTAFSDLGVNITIPVPEAAEIEGFFGDIELDEEN